MKINRKEVFLHRLNRLHSRLALGGSFPVSSDVEFKQSPTLPWAGSRTSSPRKSLLSVELFQQLETVKVLNNFSLSRAAGVATVGANVEYVHVTSNVFTLGHAK